MNVTPFPAQARADFGKGAARKLRAAGQVPAVIYRAGEEPTHITVDPNELILLYRRIGNPNLLLGLQVGDVTYNVIAKDSQKHPVSRELQHIDFYEVRADEPIDVEVPIHKTGRSPGEILGGQVRFLRRTVKVTCRPGDIPESIGLDVSGITIGQFFRASDVQVPEGCSIDFDHDYNLLTIHGKRSALAAATDKEQE